MSKVILAHAGKQHSYHVAKALHELGYLQKFYTSSYVTSVSLQQIIERLNNRFWSRRFLKGLGGAQVESNWHFELKEMLFSKRYGQSQKTLNAVYERDEKFDRYMAAKINRLDATIFWGFQGSALHSLKAAKSSGKVAVCELATAHAPAAKKILEEEKKLHPEWADSIDNVTFPDAYYQRLCEEPHAADVVIGASQFTLQTLRDDGVDETKLRYLPLGFEVDHIPYGEDRDRKPGPVKLLFAGRITQRKGIKYLLEAVKQFSTDDVELHLAGHVHGAGTALKSYKNIVLHPPMPQYELFKKYREFDLFALPSVFEGFGLVIVEAMAAGLPVIATAHTIGPELIDDGMNGYLVALRDVNAIANAIANYLDRSEEQRTAMRQRARQAALNFSWASYQTNLNSIIESITHG